MEMKDLIKQHVETIDTTMDGFGERLHKSLDAISTLDVRLADMEQKMSRRGSGGEGPSDTLGGAFASSEGLAQFAAETDRPGRFKLETKAILTSDAASAGPLAPPRFRDTIVALPQRNLVVRNLLPMIPVSTSGVDYPHMTARNNNAATVAEGNQKPQSDLTLEMKTIPIRKIAHFIMASNEILADAPQLQGLIDSELLYGLAYAEDLQLLLGDGTGTNLNGMMPQATAYSAVTTGVTIASPNLIDQIGLGMLQCALANYSPDGIVLSTADWTRMRLLKSTQGEYLLGDPGEAVEPRLFGLPVVATNAMPTSKFLVGQFQVAATLYDRMLATIFASTEDRDNFVKNLVTILAEERIGLAVKRPDALITGTFT